jgi:hypothetical protein
MAQVLGFGLIQNVSNVLGEKKQSAEGKFGFEK